MKYNTSASRQQFHEKCLRPVRKQIAILRECFFQSLGAVEDDVQIISKTKTEHVTKDLAEFPKCLDLRFGFEVPNVTEQRQWAWPRRNVCPASPSHVVPTQTEDGRYQDDLVDVITYRVLDPHGTTKLMSDRSTGHLS